MRPSPPAEPRGRRPARARRRLALAAALLLAPPRLAAGAGATHLSVPVVVQSPERCGPAALEMVLRFYGADSAAVGEAARAYDPALRGSLITDLAAAARRAGFDAEVATLSPDSLVGLLAEGVPPIALYQSGRGLFTKRHFGVVAGWDPGRDAFTLNEGRARPRTARRAEFAGRWRTAGSQALVVRRRSP